MLNRSFDDASRVRTDTSPFVGRDAELRIMRAALEQTIAGQGQVLLLTGEAGIGKTRTAAELSVDARERGALVLWGRCREWEGAPPYWPWVQIARACLRVYDPAALLPESDEGVVVIGQIIPELWARSAGHPRLPQQADVARFLLFDTFARWLSAAAEHQPLVIILDDLHRADTSSLLLLQFVAAGLVDSGVLLLGTWRDDEVRRGHPLSTTLAELRRARVTQRVVLRGWSLPEAEQYIRLSTGHEMPAHLVAAVQSETEGNPLFVSETVRMLVETDLTSVRSRDTLAFHRIPESVRDVIQQRLDRLSSDCTEALSAAAVIGREFAQSTLGLVLGRTPLDILDAVDEAQRARIIERAETHGGIRFTHALIRETLFDMLPASERVRLHQRAARALEHLHRANVAPHAASLSHHFIQALPLGDAAKAIEYTRRAGEWAIEQVAWEDAVAHFERALTLLEQHTPDDMTARCDVLLALGEARWYGGTPDQARALFQAAVDLARELESPERFARAALGVAGEDVVGSMLGDHAAVELLDEALAVLSSADSRLRVRLLCQLAFALFDGDDSVARQLALTSEALAMSRRLGDPDTVFQALDTRWFALCGPDGLPERQHIVAEQLAIARARGNRYGTMLATGGKAHDALESGDLATYRQQISAYQQFGKELRLPAHDLGGQFIAVIPLFLEGCLADADRWVTEALVKRVQSLPGDAGDRMVSQVLLAVRREQGRTDEALEIATRFAATARHSERDYWIAERAILLHEQGFLAESHREFAMVAAGDFAGIQRDGNWLNTLARLSEAATLLGDARHATILYNLLLPYPDRNATRALLWMCHGSVSHYLGLLSTTLSCWADAERHFADALEMHERMGALLFSMWTRAAWADMLVSRPDVDDRGRARDIANRALTDAVEIGSSRIERRMQVLLDSTLAEMRSVAPYALSPREMDVLRLIIDGKTDREIADALFISHRTVMRHVTGILNKLGVNSRTAAATLAVRDGMI